jgi:hypothetical protein
VEVFRAQEEVITDVRRTAKINERAVQELLSLFRKGSRSLGNMFDAFDTGYIFTPNQDWCGERPVVQERPHVRHVGAARRTSSNRTLCRDAEKVRRQ